jgi:hypothetical protein
VLRSKNFSVENTRTRGVVVTLVARRLREEARGNGACFGQNEASLVQYDK